MPDTYHLDESELMQQLRGVELLKPLEKEQIKAVADRCTEVKFGMGDDIVRQGEPGDCFFVITRGSADCLRWSPEALAASDLLAAQTEYDAVVAKAKAEGRQGGRREGGRRGGGGGGRCVRCSRLRRSRCPTRRSSSCQR